MNIHITKEQKDTLDENVICSFVFGSKLYKTDSEQSDTDILRIVNNVNSNSFVWSHHNLQYTDNETNTDYVYTTYPNFIRNLLTGDSTVNFEIVMFSGQSEYLEFLQKNATKFATKKLIRSYLGLAKRDIKNFHKTGDLSKLNHAKRGIHFAGLLQTLLDDYMPFNEHRLNESDPDSFIPVIDRLRDILNSSNEIREHPSIEFLKELDEHCCDWLVKHSRPENKIVIDDLYNSLFNDVSYKEKK